MFYFIYSLKVGDYILNKHLSVQSNNRSTRKRCEICSNLTIKIPELRHSRCSDVFIVNFEHFSYSFLVFLLLTWSKYLVGCVF